jgi:mono/diheme cytochrome c family protein
MHPSSRRPLLGLAVLGALGVTADDGAADERDGVTFHREVARVMQDKCVACHRAGGAAPFSLESYETAYNKRRMIRMVVDGRVMPPWLASDEDGPWANDLRLSDAERATILAWVDAGGPAGDPADAPPRIEWPEGWLIGEPDETFQLIGPQSLPAEGTIKLRMVFADRVVPRDMWVKQLQILPGDPEVVHHASVEFEPPPTYGMGGRDTLVATLAPWTQQPQGWQYLFGYLPGKGPRAYEEGVARFLPKGSRLRFGMHYTPKGEASVDLTQLGLVIADEEARFAAETRYMNNWKLAIPPGEKRMFTAELDVPHDVKLRSITPHMHLRGRTFVGDLIRPDGSEERLIRIPEWDQDWQISYVFAEQPVVPAGSLIRITGWYDNTAENLDNPDPTQFVRFGQQTWDEMLTMAVEWVRPMDEAFHGGRMRVRGLVEGNIKNPPSEPR